MCVCVCRVMFYAYVRAEACLNREMAMVTKSLVQASKQFDFVVRWISQRLTLNRDMYFSRVCLACAPCSANCDRHGNENTNYLWILAPCVCVHFECAVDGCALSGAIHFTACERIKKIPSPAARDLVPLKLAHKTVLLPCARTARHASAPQLTPHRI